MEDKLKRIKALVFDVDGVLTDGGILATAEGDLLRVYDAKDAMALRMASMKGFILGAITGGRSTSITKRLTTCGFNEEDIYLASRIKMEDLKDFCTRHRINEDEVMYFGDDLPDVPVLDACGCGVCPCDAVEEAKAAADYISTRPGGKGCVRESIEMVMKLQGKWELDAQQYRKRF